MLELVCFGGIKCNLSFLALVLVGLIVASELLPCWSWSDCGQ